MILRGAVGLLFCLWPWLPLELAFSPYSISNVLWNQAWVSGSQAWLSVYSPRELRRNPRTALTSSNTVLGVVAVNMYISQPPPAILTSSRFGVLWNRSRWWPGWNRPCMGLLTMLQALAKYYPRVSSCHPHHSPHGLVMASVGEGETEAGVGGVFHTGLHLKLEFWTISQVSLPALVWTVTGDREGNRPTKGRRCLREHLQFL